MGRLLQRNWTTEPTLDCDDRGLNDVSGLAGAPITVCTAKRKVTMGQRARTMTSKGGRSRER